MKEEIGVDEVLAWSRLARLGLAPEEAHRLRHDLARILEQMRTLAAVDTSGWEPLLHGPETGPVERSDEIRPPLPRAALVREARISDDGHFRVPLVVESEELRRARGRDSGEASDSGEVA